MNLDDYILISRNNETYKCQIRALSNCFFFIEAKNKFISEIYDLSSLIAETEMMFPLSHYTRNETASKFCTIEEIEALKEDATYVLKTAAAAEIEKLSSKSQVDDVFKKCSESCLVDILAEEYTRIADILSFEINEKASATGYLDGVDSNVIKSLYNNDNL